MEFWRCSKNTIFCGGEYRPKIGLCTNCRTLKYHQKAGGPTRRCVFTIIRSHYRGKRPLGGGNLYIEFSPLLFQSRKRRRFSYARVLHERATGESLPHNKFVVSLGRSGLPVFEQLVVVDKQDVREPRLTAVLQERGF